MKTLNDLLARNREWAKSHTDTDPHFFDRLVGIQHPGYLWIGCSDSRVPANQIVGLDPGEMFVQRNIANIVAVSDTNCMAVIQYAIEALGVRKAVVCGHYGCGGVRAALENRYDGMHHAERWLTPLAQIARSHRDELTGSFEENWAKLCELNVMEQVRILKDCDVVRRANQRGDSISVYGLIYDLSDGLLRHLLPC